MYACKSLIRTQFTQNCLASLTKKNMNEDFEKIVNDLIANQSKEELLTTDDEKSLIIFTKMFENGKKNLRLFARSLCDNNISNNPRFIIALSDYIDRGGSVRLLLSHYDVEEARKHALFSRLAYYQHEGKDVIMKCTNIVIVDSDDPARNQVKVCVVDNCSYRIDPDFKSQQAKSCFNDETFATSLIEIYDSIFQDQEDSVEISLETFFNPTENGTK